MFICCYVLLLVLVFVVVPFTGFAFCACLPFGKIYIRSHFTLSAVVATYQQELRGMIFVGIWNQCKPIIQLI